MLERDPSKRPTAAELLHHPWLVEAGRCRSCWTNSSSNSSGSNALYSIGSNGGSNGSNGRGQQQQQQVPLYLQPLEDSLVQRLQRYGTFSKLKQVGGREKRGVEKLSCC